MQAAPRAADDREAGVPRDPRRARRLAGAGLTALLHLVVIAALLHAGPSPPPAAAPGAVSVRLLPAVAAPPPTARPEPRPAAPVPRAAPRASAVKPAASPAHPEPAPSAAASTAATPDLTRSPSLRAPAAAEAATAADTQAVAAVDDARVAAAYVQALWTQIAAARPTGTALQGEALVGFTLDADGRLVALELLQSSGNGLLDRLALRTVRRAAPFPPPPAAAGREFRIAFHFG
ncbi:energy transducer TonB [Solimonas flava]|uniref:energy transducer TonB n=1 Tax=Solimonas flava TaxID=415849 RepID=UPI00042219C2|nr:energy transducer TonB [Solimonas flava]